MVVSDEDLLRNFCAGNLKAFDELFRRYAPRVHATAYRLTCQWEDAEDALQEVFLRLAVKGATIRRQGALSAWLYRTTIHCAADRLRSRRMNESLDAETPRATRIIAIESLRQQIQSNERHHLDSMLACVECLIPKLSERQAAVFVLRFFQGLSHREIATILDIGESGSKSLHSLACKRLRELVVQSKADERDLTAQVEGGR